MTPQQPPPVRVELRSDRKIPPLRQEDPKHAGVLIVRLPDSEQWRVGDHLVAWFSDPEARTWERCMVVATLRNVRVVRGATATR